VLVDSAQLKACNSERSTHRAPSLLNEFTAARVRRYLAHPERYFLTRPVRHPHLADQPHMAALKDGEAPRKKKHRKSPAKLSFDEIVDGYLSESHRDDPGSGCVVGALLNDVGRAGAAARKLFTGQV
jgi:hypothetical protein